MVGSASDLQVYRQVVEAIKKEIRLKGPNLNIYSMVRQQIQTLAGEYILQYRISLSNCITVMIFCDNVWGEYYHFFLFLKASILLQRQKANPQNHTYGNFLFQNGKV